MIKLTKILLASLAVLAGATTASAAESDAQTGSVHPYDHQHIGLRAQFNLSSSSTHTEFFHYGPGVSVGAVYYAPFGRLTYFNAGVLFNYDTFGLKGTAGTIHAPRPMEGHLTTVGLQVPIDFGIKAVQNKNLILGFYTGPHLYVDFSCKAKYDYNRSGNIQKVEKDWKTPGLGFGWGVGTAIDFKQHWHVHVEYFIGFGNMAMTQDLELGKESGITRTNLSLGLGYNF